LYDKGGKKGRVKTQGIKDIDDQKEKTQRLAEPTSSKGVLQNERLGEGRKRARRKSWDTRS